MTSNETGRKALPRSENRGVVLTAFVAASAMILALGTYEFMIIPAQWDIGLTVDQANATNLIPAGAALLVVFASSSLCDRLGYRRLLLMGAVCYSIGAALVALAPGFFVLLAGRALGGIGGVTMGVVGLAMVNAIFTDTASRAKAFAAFAALLPAVSFAFPPLGAILVEFVGWRSVPLLWLGLGVLTIVLALVTVPRGLGITSAGGSELITPLVAGLTLASLTLAATVAGTSISIAVLLVAAAFIAFIAFALLRKVAGLRGLDLRLLRSPGAWLVVFATMLLFGANLYFFTSLLIQYRYFDPIIFVAVILSAPELCALAGCYVSGWAATRWGAPRTASFFMLLAGLAAFFALSVGNDAAIYHPVAVLCLVAFPSAAAVGPLTQTFMDLAPHDGSSAPAAMRDALQNLGGSLGGIIAGAVGLTAFVSYTTGAVTDAGLPDDLAAHVANEIVQGTHVNDLASAPWMPPDIADLIAGSREVLNTGQSAAYWGAAVSSGIMCIIGAFLLLMYVRRERRLRESLSKS